LRAGVTIAVVGEIAQALSVGLPMGGWAVAAYLVLGLVIGLESMGIPLPGETTLIAAAYLSSRGQLDLTWVIVAAATGAVIGDSIGYAIGRRAGQGLFERLGRRSRHFSPLRIERAERYFHKYGVWTVFFGRFVALLRIFAGPMAGSLRMPYARFLAANAAGGITWATLVGVATNRIGEQAGEFFGRFAVWALGAVVLAVMTAYVVVRLRRRSRERIPEPESVGKS
jgi:membrane protein DedA with SNARE-associated domain